MLPENRNRGASPESMSRRRSARRTLAQLNVYFGENERPFRCTTSSEILVRHFPKWLFVFARDAQLTG